MLTDIEEPFAQPPRVPRPTAKRTWQDDGGPTAEDGLLELTGWEIDGATIYLDDVERLDIEGCELQRVVFANVEALKEIRIAQTVIQHTDLSRLRLRTVRQCRIADTKLVGTDLSDALVQDSTFERCVLTLANFRMATMKRTAFDECQMAEVDAYRSQLEHVSFADSETQELNVDGAKASHVDLRHAASIGLIGVNRLDGYLIAEAQLPALAHQLASIAGLMIESSWLDPAT